MGLCSGESMCSTDNRFTPASKGPGFRIELSHVRTKTSALSERKFLSSAHV